ncbi:MAG: hypothetical protein P4L51_13495 [Puia sp.]|nr:hypothetical protein [Puia sp.]
MLLQRNTFFVLLFLLFVAPFYLYKGIWIATSVRTTGKGYFMGHTLENLGNISGHLVVLYLAGKDSVTFNTADDLGFGVGDPIPVLYQRNDPSDARVSIPICVWGDTWVNSLFPFLVLLVLYFTPDFLDPLIPRRAKIRLGKKPFIRIIPAGTKNE